MSTVPVLNLLGPVGVGKSTTAAAVSKALTNKNIPHAVADLDNIRERHPTPAEDPFNMTIAFRNLASVWKNYQMAGAKCLILPGVMHKPSEFDDIRKAVPGADIFVVRLEAPLEIIHARLRGRELDLDSLHWHLDRSTRQAKELAEKKFEMLLVGTMGKTPKEVAWQIVDQWHALAKLAEV